MFWFGSALVKTIVDGIASQGALGVPGRGWWLSKAFSKPWSFAGSQQKKDLDSRVISFQAHPHQRPLNPGLLNSGFASMVLVCKQTFVTRGGQGKFRTAFVRNGLV